MTVDTWTPADLLQISGSYWQGCALHAAVDLDLFTPLADGAATAVRLAEQLDVGPRGLAMLLDALTAMKLLQKEQEKYLPTEFSLRFLVRTSPTYLGYIILHHHHLVPAWHGLADSIRSGQPFRGTGSHSRSEAELESFLLGMFNLALQLAPRIAAGVDLSGHRRLLDLGGGPGTYAIHFCRENPALQATVFDLPTTRPFAEQTLRRFAMEERISFVAGDFHADSLPVGHDVAWLSHVLHGSGEGQCHALVAKAAAALEPGGVLLVQEFILDDGRTGPLFPALFSLNMLLQTESGQSYSESQLRDMLKAAGLMRIERLPVDLPNGAGILLGRKSRD